MNVNTKSDRITHVHFAKAIRRDKDAQYRYGYTFKYSPFICAVFTFFQPNAKKSVPLLEALFFNLSCIHVVILSNVYFFFNDFFFNDIAISIYAVSIRYVVVTICTI